MLFKCNESATDRPKLSHSLYAISLPYALLINLRTYTAAPFLLVYPLLGLLLINTVLTVEMLIQEKRNEMEKCCDSMTTMVTKSLWHFDR